MVTPRGSCTSYNVPVARRCAAGAARAEWSGMHTDAAPTQKPNLDPIPLCLVVPLTRIADKLGTSADYGRLDNAGPAYADKVPTWLASIDRELAARRDDGQPSQPEEAWVEELLLGREARRALSFKWEDNKGGGALVSTLRDPTGSEGRYGGAISAQDITGAGTPELTLFWVATTPNGTASGQIPATSSRAVAAAKKMIEHAFLAAWEARAA